MKSTLLTLNLHLLLFIFSGECLAQKGERNYELNTGKSNIIWKAKNETNNFSGTLLIKSGYLNFNNDELTGAVVFVDTKSITCKECGDAESAKKILEFIKSSAFLNTDNMDYAVFKMYKSEKLENSKENIYRINGALTIIAFSHDISLPVSVSEKKDKVYAEGNFNFNRSLWRLSDPDAGENMNNRIGQTIDLYLYLEGEKK